MDKNNSRNISKTIMIVSAVLYNGILSAFTLSSNPPNLGAWKDIGIPISIFLVVAAILLHIFDLQKEISLLKNTHPNIIAVGMPKWEGKDWVDGTHMSVLGIEFKNLPEKPSEKSVALKVSATVRWLNLDGDLIRENHGRWHITNRKRDQLRAELQTVDIYPNGQEEQLHFAMKSPDGEHFYIWGRISDENEERIDISDGWYKVEVALLDSRGFQWNFNYDIHAQKEVDKEWLKKSAPQETKISKKKKSSRKTAS